MKEKLLPVRPRTVLGRVKKKKKRKEKKKGYSKAFHVIHKRKNLLKEMQLVV